MVKRISSRPKRLMFVPAILVTLAFQDAEQAANEPAIPAESDYYELIEIAPQAGLASPLGDLALEVGGL